jgi:CRISPR/Cas system-associated exonuclease Cas4 (RecB family)
LPEIAATLLLPGAARDLAAARVAIPEALGELARFLHVNALTVAATEQEFEQGAALGPNTGIRGAIDLLASDHAGRAIVIDLKWQRTDKYRRKEISDGVALQLAVYAKTIDPNSQDAATGYFMLRQKRFVTGAQDFDGPVVVVDGDSPKETWRRVHNGWRSIMDELASGRVRAQFDFQDVSQDEFDDPALMTPPKCSYCDFNAFCGGE